jgi:hypothetical protein
MTLSQAASNISTSIGNMEVVTAYILFMIIVGIFVLAQLAPRVEYDIKMGVTKFKTWRANRAHLK